MKDKLDDINQQLRGEGLENLMTVVGIRARNAVEEEVTVQSGKAMKDEYLGFYTKQELAFMAYSLDRDTYD